MLLWQDKWICDKLLSEKKEKVLKSNKKYWCNLLLKYYIWNLCEDKSVNNIKIAFEENKDNVITLAKEYLSTNDIDKINKAITSIKDEIKDIIDGKSNKLFFNNSPVVVYKEELKAIKNIKNELLENYLFVWLIWKKAYNNRFVKPEEWCYDKEQELRKLVEKDTSARQGKFKKLIEGEYICYSIKNGLNIRKNNSAKLMYKIPCMKNEGDNVAFEINDFRYIWEHYLNHFDPNHNKFCEKCGTYFVGKNKDRKNCDKCNQ